MRADLALLLKGEDPGHPSRGNQWTGGEGGGGKEGTYSGKYSATLRSGKKVSIEFKLKAKDQYAAGDKARVMLEAKHGTDLYYPKAEFKGGPARLSSSSQSKRIAERAGPEEDHGKVDLASLMKTPIDDKAHQAATSPLNDKPEPTDRAKHLGRYAKGNIAVGGLRIAIENPVGSIRRAGWPPLTAHYGYIKRTRGADDMPVDVFVREGTDDKYTGPVFVIDQIIEGAFDEHKCMIGWPDGAAAKAGYMANYWPSWQGCGAVTRMSLDDFKWWLKNGDPYKPLSLTKVDLAKEWSAPSSATSGIAGYSLDRGAKQLYPTPQTSKLKLQTKKPKTTLVVVRDL